MRSDLSWVIEQRARIQYLDPVGFLAKVARKEIDPTPHQMRAAEILLRKVLPDVDVPQEKQTDMPNVVVNLGPPVDSTEEWLNIIRAQNLPRRPS